MVIKRVHSFLPPDRARPPTLPTSLSSPRSSSSGLQFRIFVVVGPLEQATSTAPRSWNARHSHCCHPRSQVRIVASSSSRYLVVFLEKQLLNSIDLTLSKQSQDEIHRRHDGGTTQRTPTNTAPMFFDSPAPSPSSCGFLDNSRPSSRSIGRIGIP